MQQLGRIYHISWMEFLEHAETPVNFPSTTRIVNAYPVEVNGFIILGFFPLKNQEISISALTPKMIVSYKRFVSSSLKIDLLTVADPGFPGGGCQPQSWGQENLLFHKVFAENCMKMKAAILVPSWICQWSILTTVHKMVQTS